ncbi:hypothetical protein [Janthinobacterium sp. 75]|uniref:hypothetical protein n=1 Tax=Janthinobacterium sp. 75 TaxID=2135628 RepID=UPI001062D118|nr:hypothetical protein [Janthinobacterium sp. 75]TDY35689.1 hypothetical protein C8C89_3552 [Janthinobacterium sp. 75]
MTTITARLQECGIDAEQADASAQDIEQKKYGPLLQQLLLRGLGYDVEAAPDVQLGYVDEAGAPHLHGSLHDALEELDPAGRHGQPRSLELRQFGGLPGDLQMQLKDLLEKKAWSQAAVLWKRAVGGELAHCLAAMQQLARQL